MTAKKTTKKAAKKRGIKNGFEPTALQRRTVGTLIENGFTEPDVCKSVIHQITGKTITVKMLGTHFKSELGNRGEGAPRFVPTQSQRTQVEEMLGSSFTHEEIAMSIINPRSGKGISKTRLRDHFPDELARGKTTIGIKVRKKLLDRALDDDHAGSTACLIFWCKTQENFSERHQIEIGIGTGVLIAPSSVTPEAWIEKSEKENEGKKSPVDD